MEYVNILLSWLVSVLNGSFAGLCIHKVIYTVFPVGSLMKRFLKGNLRLNEIFDTMR